MRFQLLALAVLALPACTDQTGAQSASAAPSATTVATGAAIGAFGLDLTAGKPELRPGDDFFQYASGRWYATFEVPQDRPRFGPLQLLDDRAKQQVKDIIEHAAASRAAPGTPERKIGDYHAAFMDEAAIEVRGLTPAQEDLARIAAIASSRDVAATFGSRGYASAIAVGILPDPKNPQRYTVAVAQGPLGLPDRDYYLKDDPHLADVRVKYVAFIEQMLALGGSTAAAGSARNIMAFETALAQAQWSIERQRDVEANYNPRTLQELLAYAPEFDWEAFFAAAGLGVRQELILMQPTAVQSIAQIVARTPLETLRAYLTFHYLADHAQYLPKRFDEAQFAFYGRELSGQPQQPPRWKRGVELVNRALGEQVGQVYVAKHFSPDSKVKMEALVANLRGALRERIDALAWMTPATRKRAQEKLAAFVTKIGYPERWKDYGSLEVKRDDLLGNVRRAMQWRWNYELAQLDLPVDRKEWYLNAQTVNAYYNPLGNEIVFPAAILQPPFFDPNADDAVNYGAIGAVIGHEIGHGFDDQGRKYGADGRLEDWWAKEDSAAFTQRAERLIRQYSGFEALPGLHVNGANTVGENIGDLGGLTIAYHAYQRSLNGRKAPVLGGLSGEQRFFLSWAQVWRVKYREGALREQALADVHSPAYFRVNGVVRNMEAWYAAFDVQPGDKLYLKPQDRVSIW